MARVRNRWLAGIAVATMAFGVTSAAAASLGLSVNTLGADQQVVLPCDDAVTASFTTVYSATADGYVVDDVNLTSVAAACDGYDFRVSLTDAAGTSLAEVVASNATVTAGAISFAFAGDDVLGSAVERIAVSVVN